MTKLKKIFTEMHELEDKLILGLHSPCEILGISEKGSMAARTKAYNFIDAAEIARDNSDSYGNLRHLSNLIHHYNVLTGKAEALIAEPEEDIWETFKDVYGSKKK